MKKIVWVCDQIEEKYLIFQLAVSVCVIFTQVFFRYVLNDSLSWSEELARYMYIWQGWLGISLIERKRKHISITMLTDKIHGTPKKILVFIVQLAGVIIAVAMAYCGFRMVAFAINNGTKSTALHLPLFITYLAMPLGCSLYALRLFFHMLEDAGIKKVPKEEGVTS